MLGLRQKLFLAFGGLFALLAVVSVLATAVINRVSLSFDTIFHENLETIHACQEMRQSLEAMNEVMLVSLWENAPPESSKAALSAENFARQLKFQQGNVTVKGERAATDSLVRAWDGFRPRYFALLESREPLAARRDAYRLELLPPYRRIGILAEGIAELNAQNILSADGQVKVQARTARRNLLLLLLSGAFLTLILLFVTGSLVLRPIGLMTRSAKEIERGNLDLVLEVPSRDEMGQLAEAFNAMAARLREFRRSDRAKLLRTQLTTQTAINSLPDAVAVVNPTGWVDMSNDPAQKLFGIKPGTRVDNLGWDWLPDLFAKVTRELRPSNPRGYASAVQIFREGEERFFLPHAIPILDETRQLSGVTLVLADVTDLRRLDEAKSDLLSTVSHELKTRLTSVRMAVHLLLDDKVGETNARQTDLLLTAREDAERLHRMIEGLLDLGRIRSGNLSMDLKPLAPQDLILHAFEGMRHAFLDKGLRLDYGLPDDLPRVMADPSRIHLVLDNLLANALKFTPAGGRVEVKAELDTDAGGGPARVKFSVSDTGIGIPAVDLPRIFDRFYRGSQPGQPGGAGLGLAIAKEVILAHGGEMTAQSQVGQGSVFAFTLIRENHDG